MQKVVGINLNGRAYHVEEAGYVIRRLSDGSVLPVPLPLDDVRRERRRQTWWL